MEYDYVFQKDTQEDVILSYVVDLWDPCARCAMGNFLAIGCPLFMVVFVCWLYDITEVPQETWSDKVPEAVTYLITLISVVCFFCGSIFTNFR